MDIRSVAAASICVGAAFIVYTYHIRARRFDSSGRDRITLWPWYEYVDWYLKASTLSVALLAILFNHPALLELHDYAWLLLFGLATAGIAVALFGAAMWTLDAQYSPAHASHMPTEIITAGPYRFIRHPVYTSNLLLLSGLLVASGSLWIALNLLILISYYVPIIIREETAIKAKFPEYRSYAERTGRFFPRLRTQQRLDVS